MAEYAQNIEGFDSKYTGKEIEEKLDTVHDIPTLSSVPDESVLTFQDGERVLSFRIGDMARVTDENSTTGFTFYQLHEITKEGKAVWKKAVSGDGGDMETAHVVLSCEDGQNDRLIGISISIRHGITIQEQAYDGVGLTFQVPVNAQYTVSVGTLDDFDTPPAQTFIAEGTKTREISFTYFFSRYGKIRFALANGTAGNITGDVNQNFYRRASRLCRRCVVESQDTSGVHIRFLHDANSYQYADGTPATLDGKPVMVYLPECWVMCTLSEDQTCVDVEISSELKAGWQHFPESLVGAFKMGEAAVSSPNTTMKTDLTWDEAAQACWDIGEGWQLVDYRQHCLVALLLYARYGTRNIRSVIGSNKEYTGALTQTGETMTTGIQDTIPNSVQNFTNCLGLEAWTGYMQEWMAGVSVQEGSWFLFGENDEVREVPAALSTGWITRMAFEQGGHFDLIPIETGMSGSNTTGYTEFSEAVNAPFLEMGVMRANFTYNEAPDDGIARVSVTLPMQVKGKFCGARAAYYGNIIKEK